MTTERELGRVKERTSWAELRRSSLEYILMRWLERNGGRSYWPRVLMIRAWTALPRRREE